MVNVRPIIFLNLFIYFWRRWSLLLRWLSLVAVRGLLVAMASVVAGHGPRVLGL